MPVRRCADPVNVQHVWDAIKATTHQRQTADFPRLAKIIQKQADCTLAQAELYIKQTLDDDFIIEVKRITQKGAQVGSEVETFKINRQEDLQTPVDDGYDWYCIECHLAGDVVTCAGCYHVFHPECSRLASTKVMNFPRAVAKPAVKSADGESSEGENGHGEETKDASTVGDQENGNADDEETKATKPNADDYIYDESLCSICNMNKCDPGSGLDVDEFNYLLSFILTRIKSWVPEHLTSNLNGTLKFEWYTPTEMSWRAGQLFYTHMDMAAVDLKIRTKDYKNFSQFKADVHTMLHNIAIFHGASSQEHGAAEFMIRDMEYDIAELQNCVDCYKHSNEKFNSKWFCLPCRNPHKLVFAKQKGYPYWPAKVIKETDTTVDVRFFGGKYERAILPRNCIKPSTTSIASLQVKKSATFKKALDELKLHQSLLDNPSEVEAIKAIVVKPKAKPKSKSMPIEKKIKPIKGRTSLSSNTSGISQAGTATKANDSMSSISVMSDDVYEFHDDSMGELNGTNNTTPRSSKSPAKPSPEVSKRKLSYNEETPPTKARKLSVEETTPTPVTPEKAAPKEITPTKSRESDVINISDVDDERDGFAEFNDPSQNLVTSSTELLRDGDDNGAQKLNQQYSEPVEALRRKLEQCKANSKVMIVTALDSMQAEVDRLQSEHNETLKRLFESHNVQLSENKKKQWCFNCEQEAIYHCCWNTAYCSPMCQQQHWKAEHKIVCRRNKR